VKGLVVVCYTIDLGAPSLNDVEVQSAVNYTCKVVPCTPVASRASLYIYGLSRTLSIFIRLVIMGVI
jgi:hypothetical protein